MASLLERMKATLQGRDLDQEEQVKQKAQQGIEAEEARTGQPFVPEQGIEEDTTIEDTALLVAGGPAAGMAKRAGSLALTKAKGAAVDKLKERGAPKPAFHEAVSAGKETGAPSFAKFIRGDEPKAPSKLGSMGKPDSAPRPEVKEALVTPRFGTSDRVKQLQTERQSLDLKSPEGRQRLKDIDAILENRSYFKPER